MGILKWGRELLTGAQAGAAPPTERKAYGGAVDRGGLFPYGNRNQYAYRQRVGDIGHSDIVAACVHWVMRTFPEGRLTLTGPAGPDGAPAPVADHPLLTLLDRPNRAYSGTTLWAAIVGDYQLTGNAYLLKRRANNGRPAELWWLPSRNVEPFTADGRNWPFVSYYQVGGLDTDLTRIAPDDMVHFRFGLDRYDMRKGISPLAEAYREVFSDREAGEWTASVLRNGGAPSLILTASNEAEWADVDLDATAEYLAERVTGDRRGEPLILSRQVDVNSFGFNPQQMNLRELRRIPEERISALLGVPAIVVGLGAGLDRSTFANYAEARESAFESNIIPTQRVFADVLAQQLLPDFEPGGAAAGYRLDWDNRAVRVLQEDETARVDRVIRLWNVGLMTRAEARAAVALPAEPADAFYQTPAGKVTTEQGAAPAPPGGAGGAAAGPDGPA